jgi:hypothetical protein
MGPRAHDAVIRFVMSAVYPPDLAGSGSITTGSRSGTAKSVIILSVPSTGLRADVHMLGIHSANTGTPLRRNAPA